MLMSDIMNFLMTLDPQSMGIGGVAGMLATALFNHGLSKSRSKHERMVAASKELRKAFSGELSKLMNSDEDPVNILQAAYPRHKAAVEEFSIYLGCRRRQKFSTAWNTYAFHPQNIGVQFLEQYSKHLGDVHTAKRNRQLAVERLQGLRAYAKYT